MIRSNRSNQTFVKTLWPVFLLSFALALPGQLAASPGPDQGPRVQQTEKHKEKKVKKQKKQVKKQVKKQTVVQTQTARRPARPAATAPRTVVRREVVHRHEPARVETVQYRNRRGRGGADPTIAHIDGYLTGEGYRCQTLRDHDGRIYGLVGNLGNLREGDHVRLEGRFTNAATCRQGVAFDVYKVQTVWADRQHRSTLYDHLHDGPFERYSGSSRYGDRSGRDDRYERDRYGRDRYRDDYDRGRADRFDDRYDDRYERDNSGDRRLVIVRGRLGEVRGGCPILEGRDGRTYSLEGDLRGYGYGDRVKVTGLVLDRSRCGGPGIEVGEIVRD